ncbi:hypothetical protein Lpp22_1480 [Lacticaseibacillus paracasei subsp. paracasei Lpp22]|uniref:Uncharacterized protein n=1 Tax=Lacticaseibacillus paracasei subsp. paracasei Lpp22 TaxID=1256221 RepID=A0A8E0I9L4_LACPA|nr:hypothetical protein Lpp22_1480 [Lacticaseibacillus paracasei subsp. paracasei Lpp22]
MLVWVHERLFSEKIVNVKKAALSTDKLSAPRTAYRGTTLV